jgi:4-amino-4-deoxy-L-arabinose transferase-like glycosyltransferase
VRRRLWVGGPLVLYSLLRIPSFLEPHWYTDEAGYVTTARAVLQGKVLYAQIWTNKPPIHIWTVATVVELLGTSEAALHAVTFLSGLLTLLAVAYAGRRLLGRRRTAAALTICALLLGTPLLNAELLLPESLLIAPVTWAGALLVTRIGGPDARRWPLWPAAVGALAALAVGYQQTALAETMGFGLLLALSPCRHGAGSRRLAAYAGAFTSVTALWVVPALLLAGPGRVAYALVGFWVPFTQGAYPSATTGIIASLLLPGGALALLLVSAWLRRKEPPLPWSLWIWAGAALLVPAVARQPFAHYLVPSIAPVALALSSVGLRNPVPVSGAAVVSRRGPGVAARLAAAGTLAATALAGWGAALAAEGSSAATLLAYYRGAFSTLTRQQPLRTWQDTFDYRVAEDRQAAAWISAHGLVGASAVVWSADAWLYELDNLQLLMPTPPIYNDAVLLGSPSSAADQVAAWEPELVISEGASEAEFPEIDKVLADGYQELYSAGSERVWVRDNAVAAVQEAARSS